jgi:hypothetical protein
MDFIFCRLVARGGKRKAQQEKMEGLDRAP